MNRNSQCVTLMLLVGVLWGGDAGALWAQSSGSRGGVMGSGYEFPQPEQLAQYKRLDHEVALRYIALEGSAEVRVAATDIRVVLAVTNEAKTASECKVGVDTKIAALKAAWTKMKIPPDSIVVDFIAILPRYEWVIEKMGEREVAIERLSGYRMQTNIHLAVKDETTAQLAIAEAFALELTDIIAFDYWNDKIDDAKVKAQEQALQAAKRKVEQLLKPLVDDPLPVINIQEQTTVTFPESQYHSFTNSYADSVQRPIRRDLPTISAFRPKNTYYRGSQVNVDVQSGRLPMSPEISVVARVVIYLQSPAAACIEDEQEEDEDRP